MSRMLAHHPLTGKEVRIIQTDASLVKENKTLFYGKASVAHIESVSDDLNSFPTYSLILRSTTVDALLGASKRSRIIVVSKEAYDALNITTDEFKKLDVKNMIYLHEMHLMYPHLGGAWNGTPEDAAVLLAGLLRYNKIIGDKFSLESGALERSKTLGITVNPSEKPMRLWWVTQFYTTEKKRRVRELKKCLEINTDSPLIDKIILLNERVEDFIGHEKIEEVVIGKRLTYDEVFKRIAEFPDDVIAVFANADICIDSQSWKELWTVNLENKFIALLRYDVPDSDDIRDTKIFGPRPDSQDTWVVRAADVKSRGSAIWKNLDFKFGHMGCDNALALEMFRQKFLVTNPALTLKTWHFHSSEVRNYNNQDILERPVFHYMDPTGIHDLKPVMKWSSSEKITVVKPSPLRRPVLGSGVADWQRITKNVYKEGDNLYVPEDEVIFEVGECFETCDGLVFDKEKMYIGSSKKASDVWTKAAMHGLMPTLEVERALVVPWTAVAERSREMYCLRYLSKVLRLWNSEKPGDFFAVQHPFFEPILSLFDWGVESLPVLPREKDALIWAKSAVCFPVTEAKYVLKEDVDALRKYLKGWVSLPSASAGEQKRLVIVEDNFLLKADAVAVLEAKLIEAGWTINVVNSQKTNLLRLAEIIVGANGIICAGNVACYGWNWMLPEGACVFEFNGVTTDALDLSSACGLKHYMINIIQNDTKKVSREEKIASIIDEINGAFVNDSKEVDGPTIWMPKATEGFFAHPGDSFREMVRLWASAGYVNVKEHDGTMVWWNKVGADGVLLYDRPTNEWRLAAGESEKEWRLALFGNPKPPSPSAGNSVPWFFWPRRPSLVETLAALESADYDAREGLVFYGRVENAVQARRRKGDWASVCSEWSLVDGETKYPYTQEEYLARLGKARFGLCLAGYGYKCHREIECMAMGCVPVVAADVDMDSYAVPPVEGLKGHYLRVNSPEDVASAIASVSKEDWTAMSAACRKWWAENASCAGSFALTKRLASM
jgi:hypothetical protein